MSAFFDGWKKVLGTLALVALGIFLVYNVIPATWKNKLTGTAAA